MADHVWDVKIVDVVRRTIAPTIAQEAIHGWECIGMTPTRLGTQSTRLEADEFLLLFRRRQAMRGA
jgi:hypothetical protein